MSASSSTFIPGLPVVTWGNNSCFLVQTGHTTAFCIDFVRSGLTFDTVAADLLEMYPDAAIATESSGCWIVTQPVVLDDLTNSLLIGERPEHLVVRVRLEGDRFRYVATLSPFKALNAAGSYSLLFTGLDAPARIDALRWVSRLELPADSFASDGVAGALVDSTDLLFSVGTSRRFVKVLFAGGITFLLPFWALIFDLPAWMIIGSLVAGIGVCAKITATGRLFAPRMSPVRRRRVVHIVITVFFTLSSLDIIIGEKYGERFAVYNLVLTVFLLADWVRRFRHMPTRENPGALKIKAM